MTAPLSEDEEEMLLLVKYVLLFKRLSLDLVVVWLMALIL